MPSGSCAGGSTGSRSHGRRLRGRERGDDAADDRQRVLVVVGQVVGDAARARVQVAAAEVLRGDLLAGRGLHQRRAAEEDRALLADDHALVAHRGHVGAAGRAGAHHRGDLRDPACRHRRLVEEDPAEVLAVGEDLVLQRQERAAGVDEVDARQPVVQRHLLRAQVLLDRHRVVGAALDGRVVGDDHALAAADPADAGDDPRARRVAVVHAVRGQRRELQERRALVEQPVDALARQQLAARRVPRAGLLAAAQPHPLELLAQVGDQRLMGGGVGLEFVGRHAASTFATIWSRPTLSPTDTLSSVTVPSTGAVSDELHLHRLQHHDRLPGLDLVADRARARAARTRASAPAARRRRARDGRPRRSPRSRATPSPRTPSQPRA